MTHPTATANPATGDAGGAGEPPALPFSPAPIEELLRLFAKAVRAHQLYLPNNPVYKGAIDAVRNGFAPIWKHTNELSLKFTEGDIRWFSRPVLTESTKSSDSLPWTFFKDGIREIQLSPGFEQDELVKLFDILQRVRKAAPEEDDLLTMLWTADFANLRYRYVDLGLEPVETVADGGEVPPPPSPDQVNAALHAPPDESRPDVVNMQDFDATLHFLDDKELQYLKKELDFEYAADLRQNIIGVLFDVYETQTTPAIREEVNALIEQLMLLFLAAGQLRNVAYLLAETQIVVKRASALTAEQTARLGQLPDRLSAAEPLSQLLQGLDESADLPPQAELTELFQQLRPLALGTILATLPNLQNTRVRALVEQAADRLASGHTAELVQLILSPDRRVALEAARRAGAMKTAAAVVPLAKMLNSADVPSRQAAVQSLTEIGSPGAFQALERSIEDKDRDVRVAAIRALGAKMYRGVFARLDAHVKGKAIRDADRTEKMAFFEAYGAMCGDNGIPFLDAILNGKSMFGKREDPELRACAAIALGRIGTAKAQDSLQQAAAEKEVVVRSAVARAMRSGAQ